MFFQISPLMFLFNQFLYKKSVGEELICRSQSSGYGYLWMDVNISAVDKLPLIIITILALERFNNYRYEKRFIGDIKIT